MRTSVPSFIVRDCERLLESLGSHVRRMALFGSAVDEPIESANDIYLACFVEGISLHQACKNIATVRLTRGKRIGSANGGYAAAPRRKPGDEQLYHIMLLEEQRPNRTFMRINRGRLRFLDKDLADKG